VSSRLSLVSPGFVIPGFVIPGFVIPGFVIPGFVIPGFASASMALQVRPFSLVSVPESVGNNTL
jgi:hypothetical protein